MNKFLKYHMQDKKEDMKKKWRILKYLDDNVFEEPDVIKEEPKKLLFRKNKSSEKEELNKYSINDLRKIFKG